MPRQIRDVRLQNARSRRQLAPRKEPYWKELRRGPHVGYYKGSTAGTWWLREYCDGKRPKRRLGLADDDIEADGVTVFSWSQVLVAALGGDRPTVRTLSTYTVEDAPRTHANLPKSISLSAARHSSSFISCNSIQKSPPLHQAALFASSS
jgi:hypothetical protein